MLSPGETAPDFELRDHNGDAVSLSDFRGQQVVLYFYPKADTPGCTTEACGFRDNWSAYAERDVVVLGVSNDDVEDIAAFRDAYDLPFTLLSDPDGDVASSYESYGTSEMGGEVWEIAFRNTYLIDESGAIDRVFEDVSPDGHAKEILAAVD